MTTFENISELPASKAYAAINRSIKALNVAELAQEASAVGETASARIQRLVKIYSAIKPLLTILSTLALIPQAWRAALVLFMSALDAVISSPELNPDFKSGKDL